MGISHELRQAELIFQLSGELDHHLAHEAILYLSQQISLNRPRVISIDFSGVTFMDSSGLAVVLNAKRCAERVGGHLSVKEVPVQAMKIFNAANLQRMISFV